MRSLHDKRNKTQSIFRGWDYSEIIEWMEVDYKDSKYKMVKYRINKFIKTMKKAFKDLFRNRYIDEEQRENIEIKKALEFLWSQSIHGYNLEIKYKEKIEGLRTYVTRLSTFENTYIQPFWKGLSEIKEDNEFIRYIIIYLEYMWD